MHYKFLKDIFNAVPTGQLVFLLDFPSAKNLGALMPYYFTNEEMGALEGFFVVCALLIM